jgi:F0F1-type ATP synthase assembly protein I
MPGEDRSRLLERSLKALQAGAGRAGPAASASYTLIGAIIVLGGFGYLADGWWGTAPWGVVGGLVVGLVAGFYGLARAVWKQK